MATGFTTSGTPYLTKAAFDEKQVPEFDISQRRPNVKKSKRRVLMPERVVNNINKRKKVYTELDRVIDNMNRKIR